MVSGKWILIIHVLSMLQAFANFTGFLMFSLFWIATIAFTFAEAFILPLLAADAPKFVEGYLVEHGDGSSASLSVGSNHQPF
ncbi:hypothetical protein WQ57_01825 [Mesobacillus campisalis]|uniref:Uncharacterized protein n=1 Tax=Mesobacillus campisalis TaxID=1408103 RepID=A0A0M2T5D4_9BACI|nr:hypothetical protein WQ57_01825 [Mesobacillus campisalis]